MGMGSMSTAKHQLCVWVMLPDGLCEEESLSIQWMVTFIPSSFALPKIREVPCPSANLDVPSYNSSSQR